MPPHPPGLRGGRFAVSRLQDFKSEISNPKDAKPRSDGGSAAAEQAPSTPAAAGGAPPSSLMRRRSRGTFGRQGRPIAHATNRFPLHCRPFAAPVPDRGGSLG